jgi:hypothetical protein
MRGGACRSVTRMSDPPPAGAGERRIWVGPDGQRYTVTVAPVGSGYGEAAFDQVTFVLEGGRWVGFAPTQKGATPLGLPEEELTELWARATARP